MKQWCWKLAFCMVVVVCLAFGSLSVGFADETGARESGQEVEGLLGENEELAVKEKESEAVAGQANEGSCGANLTWELDEDGWLTIRGTGAMTSAPWNKNEIKEIIMYDGLTSLCEGAFSGCVNLSYVSWPDGLEEIAANAFANCSGITYLSIPDSVKTIGAYAFANCTGFTSLWIEEGVETIGDHAFDGCTALADLELSEDLRSIGSYAFAHCTSLEELEIPESVTTIGHAAFEGCTALRKMEIPENLNWSERPTYEIHFYGNGATAGTMGTQTAYFGKTVALTANKFRRDGCKFLGWSTRADDRWAEYNNKAEVRDLSDQIGQSVSLYAVWEQQTYSIDYVLNGGSNSYDNPWNYTAESETIVLENPTREGYSFGGWYTESEFINQITSIPTGSFGDMTLYAKWSIAKYRITYKLNGGTNNSKNPKAYTINSKTIELQKPTRKGYTFRGWFTDSGLKNESSTIWSGSTGSKVFYAKWTKTKYAITYKLNGGTNNSKNPKAYTITSADIVLKNPTRKGCKFGGWFSDKALTKKVTGIKKGSTGKRTFYAKWIKIKYAITYMLNGGKNNKANPATYTITDKVVFKNPSREGYAFRGWYREASFKNRVSGIAKGYQGKVTVYAKWVVNKCDNKLPQNWTAYKDNDTFFELNRAYYNGNNLVLEMVFCNNRYSWVDRLENLRLNISDSNGKSIVQGYEFAKVSIGLSKHGVKTVKLTISNAPKRDIVKALVEYTSTIYYRY